MGKAVSRARVAGGARAQAEMGCSSRENERPQAES